MGEDDNLFSLYLVSKEWSCILMSKLGTWSLTTLSGEDFTQSPGWFCDVPCSRFVTGCPVLAGDQILLWWSESFWIIVNWKYGWLFAGKIFLHLLLTLLTLCLRAKTVSPTMRPVLCCWIQTEVISGEPVPMDGYGEKHVKISVGIWELLILTGRLPAFMSMP